jgi:hypothetical protein
LTIYAAVINGVLEPFLLVGITVLVMFGAAGRNVYALKPTPGTGPK